MVPAQDATPPSGSQPEKVKRSGKPLPLETKVNFKAYFERWLAEVGISYKTWVAQHRADLVWVFLDCNKQRQTGLDLESCSGFLFFGLRYRVLGDAKLHELHECSGGVRAYVPMANGHHC